ncbi:hypothetical protein AB1Y20_010142 [Prymnesium parvum]|uniref:Uncharacterized protein n=1 Tax=Prymnesium parvum TaxID=97485 RepID=A0AB34K8L0_PRYPA
MKPRVVLPSSSTLTFLRRPPPCFSADCGLEDVSLDMSLGLSAVLLADRASDAPLPRTLLMAAVAAGELAWSGSGAETPSGVKISFGADAMLRIEGCERVGAALQRCWEDEWASDEADALILRPAVGRSLSWQMGTPCTAKRNAVATS